MKVNIYPIVSSLHNQRLIEETSKLLEPLSKKGYSFTFISDVNKFYEDADLSLVLVQSGGSENLFLQAFGKLKEPYYLLTYGTNNSLAASLEIMAFLKRHHLKGEVLHGDISYLDRRMKDLAKKPIEIETTYRLGVIGHPSDWLISSDVDYDKASKLFSIKLVDIDIKEVEEEYNSIKEFTLPSFASSFDSDELSKAYRLYLALKNIKDKHQLAGLTIRCFDLLSSLKTTACLALAIFNSQEDCLGTCEGDIPSMLSMFVSKYILKLPSFQCNPSRIDVDNNLITLAHCTLPLSMCSSYTFDTHFESGIGVGIHGEIKEGDVTLFRINADLNELFVEEGFLEKDLYEKHLCRTQVVLKLHSLDKLLKESLGNHEIMISGHHKEEIVKYFTERGFKVI